MSLGRPVDSGRVNSDVPRVPERVPEHGVAPNGSSQPEGVGIPDASPERLFVALVVPLARYASFTKWVEGNVRIVKPRGWGGEVVLTVIPDFGEDLVDLDQFERPTLSLTKPEGVQE
jgi:hypothetical protein